MTLLWVFVYKSLCRPKYSFLLSMYLGVQLLGHTVTCLWEPFRLTPEWLYHCAFLPVMWEGFSPSCLHQHSVSSVLLVSGCEVAYHCGFELHFPDGQWSAYTHIVCSSLTIESINIKWWVTTPVCSGMS